LKLSFFKKFADTTTGHSPISNFHFRDPERKKKKKTRFVIASMASLWAYTVKRSNSELMGWIWSVSG
jgi:hypothetical protein